MQLLLKSSRSSGPQFLTVWGVINENVPLHEGPPLLQGARTSAYMRTCSELEPPCSFWLQLSEYDWMPYFII